MSDAFVRFRHHVDEAQACLLAYDHTGFEFSLRHVWIVSVSAFDLYITELISEAGLRLVDRDPNSLPPNLEQVDCPLGSVLHVHNLSPSERLVFYRDRIYASVQYRSFYRPDKVSEALSFIWLCAPKEKWARITNRMLDTGRHLDRTEKDIRDELTLIGDRRDLIAHSVDTPPGRTTANPVDRGDAARVVEFIGDLAAAIDDETEGQLA